MKGIIKCTLVLAVLIMINSQVTQTEKEQVRDSYNQMIRQMAGAQVEPNQDSLLMNEMLLKQIYIWSGIALAFVLYFAFMATINMPIQKTSILYAKYVTTNSQQEGH